MLRQITGYLQPSREHVSGHGSSCPARSLAASSIALAVTAAPERGKANEAIAGVLAEALGLRPSQVGLLSGETSREKRFLIVGLGPEDVLARIAPPSDS